MALMVPLFVSDVIVASFHIPFRDAEMIPELDIIEIMLDVELLSSFLIAKSSPADIVPEFIKVPMVDPWTALMAWSLSAEIVPLFVRVVIDPLVQMPWFLALISPELFKVSIIPSFLIPE